MIYRRPNPPIAGWMSLPELQWLYTQAKKYKTIVEIGSWKGKSTHALCSGALLGGGQVTAIDHFKGSAGLEDTAWFGEAHQVDIYQIFMSRLGGFPNLSVLRMPSKEGAEKVDTAEMVFIDGGHEYEEVKEDLELWGPKATKLICGHDYQNFLGVKKAVVEKYGVPKVVETIWYFDLEKST